MPASSLSTLQRALVALTALHHKLGSRAQVLAQHRVTEADLRYYYGEWERLQQLHEAQTLPQLDQRLLGRG